MMDAARVRSDVRTGIAITGPTPRLAPTPATPAPDRRGRKARHRRAAKPPRPLLAGAAVGSAGIILAAPGAVLLAIAPQAGAAPSVACDPSVVTTPCGAASSNPAALISLSPLFGPAAAV